MNSGLGECPICCRFHFFFFSPLVFYPSTLIKHCAVLHLITHQDLFCAKFFADAHFARLPVGKTVWKRNLGTIMDKILQNASLPPPLPSVLSMHIYTLVLGNLLPYIQLIVSPLLSREGPAV